jgi:hypothetical protein
MYPTQLLPTQLSTTQAVYYGIRQRDARTTEDTEARTTAALSQRGLVTPGVHGHWQQGKRTGFELARRPRSSGAAALPRWALPSYLSLSLVILAQTNLALFAVVV